eukprot:gene16181-22006_t
MDAKFVRQLLALDVNSDLSSYYPNGWVKPTMQFVNNLKEKDKRSITKIAVGERHTLFLDNVSNIYSMGVSDQGQLGHGNRSNLSEPKLINKLSVQLEGTETPFGKLKIISSASPLDKLVVVDVCCGKDHSMLLTGSGRVYSWGDNRRGQLGHSNFESCSIPKLVSGSSGDKVKNVKIICCGSYHSACIADPGTIYVWGNADCLARVDTADGSIRSKNTLKGTIGSDLISVSDLSFAGGNSRDSCEPETVAFFLKRRVQDVCSGENFLVVKSGADLLAWGNNECGQLGIGSTRHNLLPAIVQFNKSNITEMDMLKAKIICGGMHMMLLINGQIWLWGSNKFGQIGNGSTDNVLRPVKITMPSAAINTVTSFSKSSKKMIDKSKSQLVKSISVGWRHSIALTLDDRIYGWGALQLIDSDSSSLKGFLLYPQLIPCNSFMRSEDMVVSLYGSSSRSLSVIGVDISPSAPNSLNSSNQDTLKGSNEATEEINFSDSFKSSMKLTNSKNDRNELSTTKKLNNNATSQKLSESSINRTGYKRYNLIFKPDPTLTPSISYHINSNELKDRFRQELGSLTVRTIAGSQHHTSLNNNNNNNNSLPFQSKRINIKENNNNSPKKTREKSITINGTSSEQKKGVSVVDSLPPVTTDGLLELFSPTQLAHIKNKKRFEKQIKKSNLLTNNNESSNFIQNNVYDTQTSSIPITTGAIITTIDNSSNYNQVKSVDNNDNNNNNINNNNNNKSNFNYGISMPKSEKMFLSSFAKNHRNKSNLGSHYDAESGMLLSRNESKISSKSINVNNNNNNNETNSSLLFASRLSSKRFDLVDLYETD